MQVIHVAKDGSVLKSIEGYTVKRNDAATIYALIKKINEQRGK